MTEPRTERDARDERDEYDRNVNRLAIIQQATPDSPRIAELERKIAECERKNPTQADR